MCSPGIFAAFVTLFAVKAFGKIRSRQEAQWIFVVFIYLWAVSFGVLYGIGRQNTFFSPFYQNGLLLEFSSGCGGVPNTQTVSQLYSRNVALDLSRSCIDWCAPDASIDECARLPIDIHLRDWSHENSLQTAAILPCLSEHLGVVSSFEREKNRHLIVSTTKSRLWYFQHKFKTAARFEE